MPEPDFEYGMSSAAQGDVAIVQEVYAAFARRDAAAIAAVIAPDAELFGGPTEQVVGDGEPYRGVDGLRRYFDDVARVWDQLTAHAEDYRATAGSVVVFGRLVSLVDGVEHTRNMVWTWRLQDGLVVSLRVNDLTG